MNVFIKKGFLGASINQIAKTAKINKSLIYHYFKSKEDLWINSKKYCINKSIQEYKSIIYDSVETFVKDLISIRFAVYSKSSMRMLCHWQALEDDPSKFYGKKEEFSPHALFDIAPHIEELKTRKIISNDIDTKMISALFLLYHHMHILTLQLLLHSLKNKIKHIKILLAIY